jgi:hypothetical protein
MVAAALVWMGWAAAASAQSSPANWVGVPLASITFSTGGQTYTQLYTKSYTSLGGPTCADPNTTSVINFTGACSPSQIAAGYVTEAFPINGPVNYITQFPAAAVGPGSPLSVNLQGSYPDSASPTGLSSIYAQVPISQFATATSVSGLQSSMAANASAVMNEATRATQAEAGLAVGLSQETARAQGAEAGLALGLSRETLRAQGAEAVLGSAITTEANARITDIQRLTKGYREATAIAIALGGTGVLPGKRLNLTFNVGVYEGRTALAGQGALLVNEHVMLNMGVAGSTTGGGTGGRAGFSVGW